MEFLLSGNEWEFGVNFEISDNLNFLENVFSWVEINEDNFFLFINIEI